MNTTTHFVRAGHEIEARAFVDTPEELFVAPAANPFTSQRSCAVVDEIAQFLRSGPLRKHPRLLLTLTLPHARCREGLEADVAAALARFAKARGEHVDREIRVNRYESLARLPWGIVVAIGVLLLVLTVYALLPERVQPLLAVSAPFVTVLIWVAIWNPLESLLYEGWSLKRLRSAYRTLEAARVVVLPE